MMTSARPETLQVDVVQAAGYPCVCLSGRGDCRGARLLHGLFSRLIESGYSRLMLDTRGLRSLDARSAETLRDAVCMAEEEGGVLVVVDESPHKERALKLLDLKRIADVAPSVSAAAAHLDRHA